MSDDKDLIAMNEALHLIWQGFKKVTLIAFLSGSLLGAFWQWDSILTRNKLIDGFASISTNVSLGHRSVSVGEHEGHMRFKTSGLPRVDQKTTEYYCDLAQDGSVSLHAKYPAKGRYQRIYFTDVQLTDRLFRSADEIAMDLCKPFFLAGRDSLGRAISLGVWDTYPDWLRNLK